MTFPASKPLQELDRSIVRYLNLRYLIETLGNGRVTTFASKVGKSRESLARVAGKTYSVDARIGEKLAQDIEKALNLDEGWMDRLHELPKAVPPELSELLAGAKGRLEQDALAIRADGTLPILPWPSAGQVCGSSNAPIPDASAYMLAPVPCRRGFFLEVTGHEYMPYILPGMLLQVDVDRRPTVKEAFERPTFVVVKRNDMDSPIVRQVKCIGDLLLYASVSHEDPYPFYDPSDWEYGGMVVMRLIP